MYGMNGRASFRYGKAAFALLAIGTLIWGFGGLIAVLAHWLHADP